MGAGARPAAGQLQGPAGQADGGGAAGEEGASSSQAGCAVLSSTTGGGAQLYCCTTWQQARLLQWGVMDMACCQNRFKHSRDSNSEWLHEHYCNCIKYCTCCSMAGRC
jgi:hypothetical protein